MVKKLSISLSEAAYEKLEQAAGETNVDQCAKELLQLGSDKEYRPTVTREELDQIIGARVQAAVDKSVNTALKDQTLVELETAENVAVRSMKWAKIVGFFVSIPLILFAVLFSFLGVKTYFDLRDVGAKVSDANAVLKDVETLSVKSTAILDQQRVLSEQSRQASEELIKQTEALQKGFKEGQVIVARLKKLEEEIPAIQKRQTDLEEDLRSIEGRVSLGASERDLDELFRKYLKFLNETGFPKDTQKVRIKKSIKKEHELNAFYNSATSTALIGRYFWNDRTAALREYTHHVLFLYHKGKVQMGQFGSIESGLADYFPASFLDSPLIGATAARELREVGRWTSPNDYIRNLQNDRKFGEMQVQIPIVQDAGEVWGGLWWELRDILGQKQTNPLLLTVWRMLPDNLSGLPLANWFSVTLHAEALAKAASEETQTKISALWTGRGFPVAP